MDATSRDTRAPGSDPRAVDDGIDLLTATLATAAEGLTPAQICDAALDFMVGDDPDDDVAILAIHIERGS
jgi:hypothetical protein